MAEGMEVDLAPAVRDKKRFEVKKVSVNGEFVLSHHSIIKPPLPFPLLSSLPLSDSGMQLLCGRGVSSSNIST